MSAPTRVWWRGDDFQREMGREIRDLMKGFAIIMADEVNKVLSREKSPPVSQAGTPPHQASGKLAGSWFWHTKNTPKKYTANVITNVKYARALEFGFEPRNLKPRPYILLSMEMAAPRMKSIMNTEKMVQRAVARLGRF